MEEKKKFVYNADGVPFTIYKTTKGQKTCWLLADHSTGKRRLLNNPTRKAAEQRADKIRAAMVKGQAHRMLLSNGQWQDVCMAVEVLRAAKTYESLGSAIRSWVVCTTLLQDRATLEEAVQFYLANHKGDGPPPKPIRFDDAVKLYHKYKVSEGKSACHCDNIVYRMNRLARALPPEVLLNDLTAGQLELVVVSFGVGPKTRNEYKLILGNLFAWAAKQNPPLVPKGFNPGKEMERCTVKQGEVEYLRVADLKKIIAALPAKRPHLMPLVALVCFAGLRPSEAARLEWNEIGEDYIRLPGRKSKTGRNRQIPVHPNLKHCPFSRCGFPMFSLVPEGVPNTVVL